MSGHRRGHHGLAVTSSAATERKSAASGQALAKAMRMRLSVFISRAAPLGQAGADGGELGGSECHGLWQGAANRPHQPIGGGVKNEPHLIGIG